MAILNISLDGSYKTLLNKINESNFRFITAKTLTKTAKTAQENIKTHIRETFVIRRKSGGFESSIRIKPATKQNLQSEVYTMAAFTGLQQTGGIKSRIGSGKLAIPFYDNLRQLPPRTGTNRPRSLNNSFLIKLAGGGHAIATRNKKEMKIMYFLKQSAHMPKRFNMLEIAEETALNTFKDNFNRTVGEELCK